MSIFSFSALRYPRIPRGHVRDLPLSTSVQRTRESRYGGSSGLLRSRGHAQRVTRVVTSQDRNNERSPRAHRPSDTTNCFMGHRRLLLVMCLWYSTFETAPPMFREAYALKRLGGEGIASLISSGTFFTCSY